MSQKLEQIFKIPIEDQSDDGEVKIRMKPTNLSQAFRLASQELKQLTCDVGRRAEKTACAIGVLGYYFGDKDVHYNKWMAPYFNCDKNAVDMYEEFDRYLRAIYNRGCVNLNNNYGWTFDDFARAAEEIGL